MSEIKNVKIALIKADINQPRKTFNEESLKELSLSIKKFGVLQPITVRELKGEFIIITGERRYRASLLAKKKTIPCIINSSFTDNEVLEIQIIENLQREEVDVIEESDAINTLKNLGYKEKEIALKIGKSIPFIYQRIALSNLIDDFKVLVKDNSLKIGMALKIASLSVEEQEELFIYLEDSLQDYKINNFIGNKSVDLRFANFPLDKKNFTNKTIDCNSCPFNSKNKGDLFGENLSICQKPSCFILKKEKALKDVIEHCKENNIWLIANEYNLLGGNSYPREQAYIDFLSKHKLKALGMKSFNIIEKPNNLIDKDLFVKEQQEEGNYSDEEINESWREYLATYNEELDFWNNALNDINYQTALKVSVNNWKVVNNHILVCRETTDLKDNVNEINSSKKMDECTPIEKIERIKGKEIRKKEIESEKLFLEVIEETKLKYKQKDEELTKEELIAFCVNCIDNLIGWESKNLFYKLLNIKNIKEVEKVYRKELFNQLVRAVNLSYLSFHGESHNTNFFNGRVYNSIKGFYKDDVDAIENRFLEEEKKRMSKINERIEELEK